jgi:hypothetical protein
MIKQNNENDKTCQNIKITCAENLKGNSGSNGLSGFNGTNLIPFSSGPFTDLFISPIAKFLGFGNSLNIIDTSNDIFTVLISGFAFPVPSNGTLTKFEVSADLMSAADIKTAADISNGTFIIIRFLIFISSSSPNALTGFDHPINLYTDSGTEEDISFGFNSTITANVTYSSSGINDISIPVNAGDRITVFVVGMLDNPPDVLPEITVSVNACLSYIKN